MLTHDAFGKAPLVGYDSADERHEIDHRQKSGIDLSGDGGVESEFRLQKQQEDGQHGVVSEAFAYVGECKDIEAVGLFLNI